MARLSGGAESGEVAARAVFAEPVRRGAERGAALVVEHGAAGVGAGSGGSPGAAHGAEAGAAAGDLGAADHLKLLDEVSDQQVDLFWGQRRTSAGNGVNKLGLKALPKRLVACEGRDGSGRERSAGATKPHRALGRSVELLSVELAVAVAQQRKELFAERIALRVAGGGHGR